MQTNDYSVRNDVYIVNFTPFADTMYIILENYCKQIKIIKTEENVTEY